MDNNHSQLDTQQEIDHQAPLQPSTHIHPLYPPPPDNYADFDTTQKLAAPPVTPAPVMFPGQTMLFMFLMMVAAAFLGSTLFYLMWLALRTMT
jgi:hypothetical protein